MTYDTYVRQVQAEARATVLKDPRTRSIEQLIRKAVAHHVMREASQKGGE